MNALLNSLTEAEFMLVRETEADRLAGLDEDGLLDLHARIRRARTKYAKNYRREAGEKVAEVGGRGKAFAKNTRNRDKAEVFEQALAAVSKAVAAAAKASAAELKAERLEAARAARNTAPPRPAAKRTRATPVTAQRSRPAPSSAPATKTAMKKRQATSQAKGTRRQAARDAR